VSSVVDLLNSPKLKPDASNESARASVSRAYTFRSSDLQIASGALNVVRSLNRRLAE
jgi:hypothetical protein